jgi:hypothetical protein
MLTGVIQDNRYPERFLMEDYAKHCLPKEHPSVSQCLGPYVNRNEDGAYGMESTRVYALRILSRVVHLVNALEPSTQWSHELPRAICSTRQMRLNGIMQ